MPKVVNPNWVDPIQAKIDNYRQAFIDYVNTLPTDQQWIEFDAMRAHFNKTPAEFPDGEIHEILLAIGVEPNEIIFE